MFNNFNTLDDLKAGVILSSDGTNLNIKYSGSDTVVVDKYYKNNVNSVTTVQASNGDTISLADLLDLEPVAITGSGKINGTEGDDKVFNFEFLCH